jgi:hypothetical protein
MDQEGLTTRLLLAGVLSSLHVSFVIKSTISSCLLLVHILHNDYRYIMVYQDHMTKCVVKRTPYKVMFGVEAKVGLTSSSLPDEIISKISTLGKP